LFAGKENKRKRTKEREQKKENKRKRTKEREQDGFLVQLHEPLRGKAIQVLNRAACVNHS
jgi:hypothetical protein